MSADSVFLCLIAIFGLMGFGWSAYRFSGVAGVIGYLKGMFYTALAFVLLFGLHIALHCGMETCEASTFYRLIQ